MAIWPYTLLVVLTNLNYSRVEANPTHPNIKVEAVAHEAVVNCTQVGYNEGFVVRSARPKGKRC